jgi:hypothetical protein
MKPQGREMARPVKQKPPMSIMTNINGYDESEENIRIPELKGAG